MLEVALRWSGIEDHKPPNRAVVRADHIPLRTSSPLITLLQLSSGQLYTATRLSSAAIVHLATFRYSSRPLLSLSRVHSLPLSPLPFFCFVGVDVQAHDLPDT